MTFYKIDLLPDDSLTGNLPLVGDRLSLVQPPALPGMPPTDFVVLAVETFKDVGNDPLSGKELTRVVLTLTDEK